MDFKETVNISGYTFEVRTLTKDDSIEYLNCLNEIIENCPYLAEYKEDINQNDKVNKNYLERKNSGRNCYFGAFSGNELIALVFIGGVSRLVKESHRACLSIMIKDKFTNLGLGYYLINKCKEIGKDMNYEEIDLDVVSSNSRAIHLYEKLGFVEYGRNKRQFKLKNGEYQEEVLMFCDLKNRII